MGIVTDLSMILTIVFSLQKSLPIKLKEVHRFKTILMYLIFIVAFWNVAWFASQNLHSFWGKMSLASGISTLIVGFTLTEAYHNYINKKRASPLTTYLVLFAKTALLFCIAQYSTTLIMLNLG